MSKQPTARMIKFASDIGAIKNGKPNRNRVAEELATIAIPELLEGKPGSQASSTELSFICTFHLSKKDF